MERSVASDAVAMQSTVRPARLRAPLFEASWVDAEGVVRGCPPTSVSVRSAKTGALWSARALAGRGRDGNPLTSRRRRDLHPPGVSVQVRLWCTDRPLLERSWSASGAVVERVRRSAADDAWIHRATCVFAAVMLRIGLAETDTVERSAPR
jgi:hypothetical protein